MLCLGRVYIMLIVIVLSVVMLCLSMVNVVMLVVIVLSVIMLCLFGIIAVMLIVIVQSDV
jgi:hypothetical protein